MISNDITCTQDWTQVCHIYLARTFADASDLRVLDKQ